MKQITIATTERKQVVDITDIVQKHIEPGYTGVMSLFVLHTTAALTTADLDPGTDQDMLDAFEQIIPKLNYRHPHDPMHVGDHIMSSVVGPGLMVPVRDGQLVLGRWQRLILVELDGPRERQVAISTLK